MNSNEKFAIPFAKTSGALNLCNYPKKVSRIQKHPKINELKNKIIERPFENVGNS